MTKDLFTNATVRAVKRIRKKAACPACGAMCRKNSTSQRRLRDIGLNHPVVLEVTQSVHYCRNCRASFKLPIDDLAEPGSHYARAVKDKALASVFVDGLPIDVVVSRMFRDFHVVVPPSTLYSWMGKLGEKSSVGRGLLRLGA